MQFSSLHAYVKSNDVGIFTKLKRALSGGKAFSRDEVRTIVDLHKAERPDSDHYLTKGGKVLIVSDDKTVPLNLPNYGIKPDNNSMVISWTETHGYARVSRIDNDASSLADSALELATLKV